MITKHRYIAGIIAAAVMVSAFSGCGGKAPTAEQVLPDVKETAIENFEYEYDAELGGMVITAYLAKIPEVHIPDTIEGYPVVSADLGDADITHLYMPETIIDLQCNSKYIEYANYPSSELGTMFRGSDKIKEVYVESDSIPEEAFSGCENLTSVILADGVTSIGDSAFNECTNLQSINIPDGVTAIGDYAFKDCLGLTSITIPNGVTVIGRSAFECCTNINNIDIPDSVNEIGSFAFAGCTNIASINIPDGLTVIEWCAFAGCSNLTSITIPNSVTKLGLFAFEHCTGLTSVTIPDSVTSIERSFAECTGLTSATIPESAIDIKSVFENCTNLTTINYKGNTYTHSDIDALSDMLKYPDGYIVENGVLIACAKYYEGEFTVPDDVTLISSSAFNDCDYLTSVIIPDSVTAIDDYAFSGCDNLNTIVYKGKDYSQESIYDIINYPDGYVVEDGVLIKCPTYYKGEFIVPDEVTSIEYRAFENCTDLNHIIIPDHIVFIDTYAFEGCTNLNITYGGNTYSDLDKFYDALPEIKDDVLCSVSTEFKGEFTIPDKVVEIGSSAFSGCKEITSIVIPDSVTLIGANAFQGCINLTSVVIPDNVTSIPKQTFHGCTNLTTVDIPSSVTSIGRYAFYGCDSLTSVTIPKNVTSISEEAFERCTNLKKVTYKGKTYSYNNIDKLYNAINNQTEDTESTYAEETTYIPPVVSNPQEDTSTADYTDISQFKYVIANNEVSITEYIGTDSIVSIPTEIHGLPVTSIQGSAVSSPNTLDGYVVMPVFHGAWNDLTSTFNGNTTVTRVIIPNSVTSIGDYAFDSCASLKSVNIPDSVTSIGTYSFARCSSLRSINIPKSVTTMGSGAFYCCSSLTSVTIPNTVTSIGRGCFTSCSSLTEVDIPNGVTSIGASAFSNCSALTTVKIPSSVTLIDEFAFSNCTSLTAVAIPKSVTKLGREAFSFCTNLSSISIPNSVTNIINGTFANCINLKSATYKGKTYSYKNIDELYDAINNG